MDEWLSSVTDINIQTRLFYKSPPLQKIEIIQMFIVK